MSMYSRCLGRLQGKLDNIIAFAESMSKDDIIKALQDALNASDSEKQEMAALERQLKELQKLLDCGEITINQSREKLGLSRIDNDKFDTYIVQREGGLKGW